MKRRFGMMTLRCVWMLVAACVARGAAATEPVSLTILATSDLHGHICNWDYVRAEPSPLGLATVATIVNEERRKDPRLLLLDGGDTLQGTPLMYWYNTRDTGSENPMAAVMNALRYNAATIGNHDYDFGQAILDKFIREARFPVMSANIRDATGAERYTPYTIANVNGVKVGILGLTTTGVPSWEKPENVAGLRFVDAVATAEQYVSKMKEAGAMVIVALVHCGPHLQPAEDSAAGWMTDYRQWVDKGYGAVPRQNFVIPLAEKIPEIDVIVSGHTHLTIPQAFIRGVLLVEPYCWGRGVSKITLTVGRNGKVLAKKGEFLSSQGREPDPAVLELARGYQSNALEYVNAVIGAAAGAFPGGEKARRADGPLVDFINAVQLQMARDAGHAADVSATTLFSNTAHLKKGPIKVSDLYDLYPYENTLWVVEVSGAALRAALEHDARYWAAWDATGAEPAAVPFAKPYQWDMFSGIDYDIDLAKPVGHRVVRLQFKGRDVRSDTKLTLAINSFRAAGGGGFWMYKDAKVLWRGETAIRDALADYVARRKTIRPEDYFVENWRLLWPIEKND